MRPGTVYDREASFESRLPHTGTGRVLYSCTKRPWWNLGFHTLTLLPDLGFDSCDYNWFPSQQRVCVDEEDGL